LDKKLFDYEAEDGKFFYCSNGMRFKSIRELQNALNGSSVETKKYLMDTYAPIYKNDFANWVVGVFSLVDLGAKMYPVHTADKMSELLNNYEKEVEDKKREEEQNAEKEKQKSSKSNQPKVTLEVPKPPVKPKLEVPKPIPKKTEQKIIIEVPKPVAQSKPAATDNQPKIKPATIDNPEELKNEISQRYDRSDIQFDRVKKMKLRSFFNKAEFEQSVEDLKNRYDEIAHSISEHRKEGMDMSIPAMMLRNIFPKITYFQISQNKADHDRIVELMDNTEREINYSKQVENKDLKVEILKEAGIVTERVE
jgi:hypothetical protein